MQIHVPDPAYTASAAHRAHVRSALVVAAAFVAVLVVIYAAGAGLGLPLQRYGVLPSTSAAPVKPIEW